ncbi:hypothetical protein [Streptomyces sp. NPDC048411]|uniref:hypothetical protein n=1 Tax=Streptomyces sp. NPDC048411 TaxID=3157206 RepID=UPI00345664B4
MSHTLAYPLLRTTDLEEVFALADRLLVLTAPDTPRVTELRADVSSWTEFRELLAVVPDTTTGTSALTSVMAPAEPLSQNDERTSVELRLPGPDRALEATRAALGVCDRLIAYWDHFAWPEVPELGLNRTWNYVGLQVSFHHDDINVESAWTPEHSLYIHTGEEERAHWLAARVGARVIGEPQSNYY